MLSYNKSEKSTKSFFAEKVISKKVKQEKKNKKLLDDKDSSSFENI